MNAASVLWPVIFIIDCAGKPDRNILVAKLLRAVCVVTRCHFGTVCDTFLPRMVDSLDVVT